MQQLLQQQQRAQLQRPCCAASSSTTLPAARTLLCFTPPRPTCPTWPWCSPQLLQQLLAQLPPPPPPPPCSSSTPPLARPLTWRSGCPQRPRGGPCPTPCAAWPPSPWPSCPATQQRSSLCPPGGMGSGQRPPCPPGATCCSAACPPTPWLPLPALSLAWGTLPTHATMLQRASWGPGWRSWARRPCVGAAWRTGRGRGAILQLCRPGWRGSCGQRWGWEGWWWAGTGRCPCTPAGWCRRCRQRSRRRWGWGRGRRCALCPCPCHPWMALSAPAAAAAAVTAHLAVRAQSCQPCRCAPLLPLCRRTDG